MAGNSVIRTGEKGKAIEPPTPVQPMDYKVPQLEPFSRDQTKLKGFLVKCELYFRFNHTKFMNDMDKVLWTVTLLKGPAFDQMEAHVTNYMENKGPKGELVEDDMFRETLTIFSSWEGFKKRISRVFSDIN